MEYFIRVSILLVLAACASTNREIADLRAPDGTVIHVPIPPPEILQSKQSVDLEAKILGLSRDLLVGGTAEAAFTEVRPVIRDMQMFEVFHYHIATSYANGAIPKDVYKKWTEIVMMKVLESLTSKQWLPRDAASLSVQVAEQDGNKDRVWEVRLYYRPGAEHTIVADGFRPFLTRDVTLSGIANGPFVVYQKHKPQLVGSTGAFLDGKAEGVWTNYHNSGAIERQVKYSDGRIVDTRSTPPWWKTDTEAR